MSQFGTFSEYPKDSLVSAEKALLTDPICGWACGCGVAIPDGRRGW